MQKQTNNTRKRHRHVPRRGNKRMTWRVYDTANNKHSALGVVDAPDIDRALTTARRNWPDSHGELGVLPEREAASRWTRLHSRAESDLRATAFDQAAQAVIFHRLGYRVTWISTGPFIPPLRSAADALKARIGHIRVVGIPMLNELRQPGQRFNAEIVALALMAGAFARAHPAGGDATSGTRASLKVARDLLGDRANADTRALYKHLKRRAEWMVCSDFDDIEAVARELILDREMAGEAFRAAMAYHDFIDARKKWLLGNPFRPTPQSRPDPAACVSRF